MPSEVKWTISLAVGLGLLFLGWKYYFVLVTLHILICSTLIIVVLLQSGEAAEFLRGFPIPAGTRLASRPMPPLDR